eukprot:5785296-Ditylum_brightwellii.AAC.1
MNAGPLQPAQGPSSMNNSELHHPDGGVPDGTATGDRSTTITDLDGVQNELAVCQNLHIDARGALPEQYRKYPCVIGTARGIPSEITFQNVMAANHAASFVTSLPSYNDMALQEVDRQVVHRPDAHLFDDTMEEEMTAMEALGVWEKIHEAAVPYTSEGVHCSIIESTWAFKVKCFPDGSVKKYTACAELTIGQEVYMSYPRGWEKPNKVLRLTKSVYGLLQAPLHGSQSYQRGLRQQDLNLDESYIDKMIDQMKDQGFSLFVEDNAA